MRTADLIEALAADSRRTPPGLVQQRLAWTALAGAGFGLILVLGWLKLRPDMPGALSDPFFWIKAAYTGALAAAGFWACERLARPGESAVRALTLGVGVIALFAVLGAGQFMALSPADQTSALRGGSWTVCTRNILAMGLPVTVLVLAILRGFAPVRHALTGLAGGAFAGAVAATVYGLHCPEATYVFVALWYTLGVLGCAAFGAALGRWMLRW